MVVGSLGYCIIYLYASTHVLFTRPEVAISSQGFTRCEQECKTPADGVGWLALVSRRERAGKEQTPWLSVSWKLEVAQGGLHDQSFQVLAARVQSNHASRHTWFVRSVSIHPSQIPTPTLRVDGLEAKVLSPMDSVRDLPAALVEAGAARLFFRVDPGSESVRHAPSLDSLDSWE